MKTWLILTLALRQQRPCSVERRKPDAKKAVLAAEQAFVDAMIKRGQSRFGKAARRRLGLRALEQ